MIAAFLLAAVLASEASTSHKLVAPPIGQFLNCAGLREYPRGTRFKIEPGQRFDAASFDEEHRFVVFRGAVGLIYFRLLDEPGGGFRGEATSLNADTWEHETSAVTCRFETNPAG
jgi:hypothetical protein